MRALGLHCGRAGDGDLRTFNNRPPLEVNLSGNVGRGLPDFGVSLTVGVLFTSC